ncbi:MAG: molybdenum cofactor biosynthesis protein MoaE, partial [Gammaproteobacteria bacterium]
ATASFVGTMRDFNAGDRVNAMFLEHYPSMTEKYLQKLVSETNSAFGLLDSLIVHRVGEIRPADPIVLIACWSAHRAAAFDACRHAMEKLKSEAPFWKKERLEESSRWVSGLTSE